MSASRIGKAALGCFCHQSVAALKKSIATLAAGLDSAAELTLLPGAQRLFALAAFLDDQGLPAPAFAPDRAWLALEPQLAPPPLDASATATILLLAQARAQVQASLDIDLLDPQGAAPFRRIVATLAARLSAMAEASAGASAEAASGPLMPWVRLAALDRAAVQVRRAITDRTLTTAPSAANNNATPASWNLPPGTSWPQWQGLVAKVQAMAPLLAACHQLGIASAEAGFATRLAAALRTLRQVTLPTLPQPDTVAGLITTLSAIAQLKTSLGVDPLVSGYAATEGRVRARLAAVLPALPAVPEQRTTAQTAPSPTRPSATTTTAPPPLPTAGSLVTPAVMQALAAISVRETTAMTWQVPAAAQLSLVSQGLPAIALIDSLRDGLSLDPIRAAPCGHGCDAATLARRAA